MELVTYQKGKMTEIKVRKPRISRCFAAFYERHSKNNWRDLLPNNGDKIKLTWLPNPINTPFEKSTYIGMQGIVEDMDKTDGSFSLVCESCILICLSGNFNYEKLSN